MNAFLLFAACAMLQLGRGAWAAPSIEANGDGIVLHVDDLQDVTVQAGSGDQYKVITSQSMGQFDALLAADDDGPDTTVAELIKGLVDRADAAENRLAKLEASAADDKARLDACEKRSTLVEVRADKLEASAIVTADSLDSISEAITGLRNGSSAGKDCSEYKFATGTKKGHGVGPGAVRVLACPSGSRLAGPNVVVCHVDGQWSDGQKSTCFKPTTTSTVTTTTPKKEFTIYVTPSLNNQIYALTPGGQGVAKPLGPKLDVPLGLAVDAAKNLWAVEHGGHVRKISTAKGSYGEDRRIIIRKQNGCKAQMKGDLVSDKGNAADGTCVFPFTYGGVEYKTCATPQTYGGAGWCAFDSVYKTNRWGYCTPRCGGHEKSLTSPWGLVLDSKGDPIIASTNGRNIIQIINPGTTSEKRIVLAEGFRAFNLAIDAQDNVYAAVPEGNTIRKITPGKGVVKVYGAGQLRGVQGVAIMKNGNIITSDFKNNILVVIDVKTGAAKTWAKVQGPGSLAVDDDGNVYVVENGLKQVLKIAPNGQRTPMGKIDTLSPILKGHSYNGITVVQTN